MSLTERCNLQCIYCHREGYGASSTRELSPIQIQRLVETAAELGMRKVKLTGGEPLLRSDLAEIVGRISKVKGIVEVSLTTNGILLSEAAWKLKEAGLARVNVNLPSLRGEVYKDVTGSPLLGNVLEGIAEAEKAGLTPVKLNMVVLKGLNEQDVWSAMKFIEGRNLVLQLIELEKIGAGSELYGRYYSRLNPVEEKLEAEACRVEVRPLHNRKIYYLKDGRVKVELVRPFHNSEFCANCKRLRVTADGKLKPCLMRNDNLVDVAPLLLHNPFSRRNVEEALRRAVALREPFYPRRARQT
ncbi:MAG: GTP 3',8-cyclase MoaA [Candidatus Hecatellaceae archaeon]